MAIAGSSSEWRLARLMSCLSGWLQDNDRDRQLLLTVHNPAALDGLDLLDSEVRLFVGRDSSAIATVKPVSVA